MPRKTPSTANAVPLPQEGGLGDIAHKMLYYAVGVCGLEFDGTMPEFGCRHCRLGAYRPTRCVPIGWGFTFFLLCDIIYLSATDTGGIYGEAA